MRQTGQTGGWELKTMAWLTAAWLGRQAWRAATAWELPLPHPSCLLELGGRQTDELPSQKDMHLQCCCYVCWAILHGRHSGGRFLPARLPGRHFWWLGIILTFLPAKWRLEWNLPKT